MSGADPSVWTVRIHGEADDVFDAVLRTIPSGYVVRVEHAEFEGDAEWGGAGPRDVTVRPVDEDGAPDGRVLVLDWAGLDALEVY